jgi:hypothetical protein
VFSSRPLRPGGVDRLLLEAQILELLGDIRELGRDAVETASERFPLQISDGVGHVFSGFGTIKATSDLPPLSSDNHLEHMPRQSAVFCSKHTMHDKQDQYEI